MMPSLIEIQAHFQNYLLDKSRPILDEIVSTPRIRAETRMDVYENAYRLRLIETLTDNFTGLHGLAGDRQFEKIAREYIDAVPSVHKNIRWYGGQMSDFLRHHSPWNARAVLAEMAEADWSILLAFDAPNASRVDEQAIMALPVQAWESLKFVFHPSVNRIDVSFNVFKFRKQFIDGSEEIVAPEKLAQPTGWVIWRHRLKQLYRSMQVDEAWAMDQAIQGTAFPDLCEGLCEWIDPEHAAARAAGFLKQWVADGLIAKIEYQQPV